MTVTVYAGSSRFLTRDLPPLPARETRHSFSFGPHHDPANLGFGPLVAHNDDELAPGGGYPDHPHRDLEIVTWVLEGVLVHTDSSGRRSALEPGTVQVQGAGSGIRHSELADVGSGRTRFVQAWVLPDEPGGPSTYAVADLALDPDAGLVDAVGPRALPVRTAGAALAVGRLRAGQSLALPRAPRVHLFVAAGVVELGTGADAVRLGPGDAARLVDEPERPLRAAADAELLVWSFEGAIRPAR